jgi:hypothetical protein
MTSKKRTWGQFATPTDLMDVLLGFCLRRPEDRLLDPSCGDGRLLRRAAQWRGWLATADRAESPGALVGVELDPDAAASAAMVPGTTVVAANFLALDARDFPPFDAIVGNPPYTRAEWIGRLDEAAGQLALFPDDALADEKASMPPLLPRELTLALGGRAGLHAYFFLHSHAFLRAGGWLGFVAPNGWLDVAYGRALKCFLLDHFRIVAVIESAVERWFAGASVNTCAIILERLDDPAGRAANRASFASLRQPLADLLGRDTRDARRMAAVTQLVADLRPSASGQTPAASVRARQQGELTAGERWGLLLRAPEFILHRPARHTAPLGDWAAVHRGVTTGANGFFYLCRERVEQWAIEPEFRRPLLKSLRGLRALRVGEADCRHELLCIPEAARLQGTAAAEYLAWGEARGVNRRITCAGRRPWYTLPGQSPGALLLAKGVWQRHFAPVVEGEYAVDQQIYRVALVDGVSPGAAAALLNSAWFALQSEIRGRVNLGEGVLWLATYELGEMILPDPRTLDDATRRALEERFRQVAGQPVGDTIEALTRPERRALDEMVFDLVCLSTTERAAAREALVDCLEGRRRRARCADDWENEP